jgi:hypothetical protein
MAAMRLEGTVGYDRRLVAASVLIAVGAATVALWFTTVLRRTAVIIGAAMVMGVAVCGMHYTGMLAVSVHPHAAAGDPQGTSAAVLLVPIVLLVIFVVVGLIYSVLAAPTEEDRAAAASVDWLIADRQQRESIEPPGGQASRGGRGGRGGFATRS